MIKSMARNVVDDDGSLSIRNWGFYEMVKGNLGLQLMSSVAADRDTKPLLPNGTFLQHYGHHNAPHHPQHLHHPCDCGGGGASGGMPTKPPSVHMDFVRNDTWMHPSQHQHQHQHPREQKVLHALPVRSAGHIGHPGQGGHVVHHHPTGYGMMPDAHGARTLQMMQPQELPPLVEEHSVVVRNKAEASEPTVVRQEVMKASYKVDVVQRRLGNLQKQVTGLQERMNRVETLLQGLVYSQGRRASHLRPIEEPRNVSVLNQPREMEMTRRIEDLRQSNLDSAQGIHLMGVPEGNFNFPSTSSSVVATGWGQDQWPNDSLRRIEWENPKVPATLDGYRKLVVPVIEEYFSTGDVELAASELRILGSDQFHHYFVKKLISMAMDRHDKEKEMASVLLSALYADLLSSSKMSEGFMMLLESTEDLAVDIPDAIDVLAVFVVHAVVDEILLPVFLTRARALLPESFKGVEVLRVAKKSYLSAPHHVELVERKWGGSTYFTVEDAKKRIQNILREYIESGDADEAFRCIRELGLPFFHHEVVKRALILGMENILSKPLILKLLKESTAGCLISSNQMSKGFSRLAESVDDLSLDIPSAITLFDKLVSIAISEEWLDASFSKSAIPDGTIVGREDKKRSQVVRIWDPGTGSKKYEMAKTCTDKGYCGFRQIMGDYSRSCY